ncbi:MAG: outer membrane protein transport protein [Sulfuricurvum sp.]|uniref:OmpP1/FadL family transporter n=1 Tax=Sulfuricurvum sp. TaxID=2025608 RepID=UPI0027329708|nr:outer membrane protein transport protein [Sulfuricurvum sp.]MDP2849851.1 outer membrane protein transport protein [Sulfuricurvum sp.]
MRILALSVIASVTVMAGGYKIPEVSLNGTALSAAYVANAHGADAAYYNPAAMIYNEDANLLEVDATYIGLSSIDFDGTSDYSSKEENFLVPSLHFASKKLGDSGVRVGLSVVVPAGLSKRWENPIPKATAEEFTLETVEFNPSLAVALSDTVSMGVGFRMVKTDGVVKSSSATPTLRDMSGDSIDYGYNLALNYRPISHLSLAATYRSKIDLTVEGSAALRYLAATYSGPASVTVPIPATLNLSAAYTFETGTTVEAVYDRTFWSAYKKLDFEYSGTPNAATVAFGAPIPKNWKNTSSYRLGLTQHYDKWTAMAGFAYDESPVPESTLGYELPDSDAWMVSLGGRYQLDEHWNIGLAGLIDVKKSREVHNSSINGEFSNARAYLVTAGIEYRF